MNARWKVSHHRRHRPQWRCQWHLQVCHRTIPCQPSFSTCRKLRSPEPKDIFSQMPSSVLVQTVFSNDRNVEHPPVCHHRSNLIVLRERIRTILWVINVGNNFGVKTLVDRIEQKLRQQAKRSSSPSASARTQSRILRPDHMSKPAIRRAVPEPCPTAAGQSQNAQVEWRPLHQQMLRCSLPHMIHGE